MSPGISTAALYGTIWFAIVLFVAAEAGKAAAVRTGHPVVGWPWAAWMAGAVLLAIHIAIALDVHHDWRHASVVRTVEDQTRRVYGVSVGAGVWINYAFLSLWLLEALWWRLDPHRYFSRPQRLTVVMRTLYALIMVNGAVLFAAPARRILGVLLMIALVWIWRDTFRPTPALASEVDRASSW